MQWNFHGEAEKSDLSSSLHFVSSEAAHVVGLWAFCTVQQKKKSLTTYFFREHYRSLATCTVTNHQGNLSRVKTPTRVLKMAVSCVLTSSNALMMEVVSTCETSINSYRTKRSNVPKDSHRHRELGDHGNGSESWPVAAFRTSNDETSGSAITLSSYNSVLLFSQSGSKDF